jgi:hypothetical protein
VAIFPTTLLKHGKDPPMKPFSLLPALVAILVTASAASAQTVVYESASQAETRTWVSGHYEWIGDTWGYVPGHWLVTPARCQTTEVDRDGDTVVYVERPTTRVVYVDPPPCQSTVVIAPACPPPVVYDSHHHYSSHSHGDVHVAAPLPFPVPVPVPVPFIDPLFFLHHHHH